MERKSSDVLSVAPAKNKGKARATVRYYISVMPCSFDSERHRKAPSSATTSNLAVGTPSHLATTAAANPGAPASPFARENVPKEPASYSRSFMEDSDELPFYSEGNAQTGSGLRESQQDAADKRRLQRRSKELAVQQARV